MTKEIRRLSIVMLLMFLALFGATSWIQGVDSENLAQNPNNTRSMLDSYEIKRGSIIVQGTAIAESVPKDDQFRWQRVYTDSTMWAPVTGYFNPALGGTATGLERAMNSDLSGTGANAFFAEVERIFSGKAQQGFSVETTLNAKVQKAAFDALGDKEGAVVAIEPKTGRILAMVSTPSFDANAIADHSGAAANAAYQTLVDDTANPLFNRALAGNLNPPGSTFKLVVAAAAYATGKWTPSSTLPDVARYTLPGTSTQISNASGTTCGSGTTVSISDAVRLSCNIPMAQLAHAIGNQAIADMADKFGFNTTFDVPMRSVASSYPRGLNDAQNALTGFGQGQTLATPLQMAMVSAGIANDGVVMNPRLVDAVIGDNLLPVREYENTEFSRAVEPDVADAVTQSMVASVANGAAPSARIEGVDVAGKTGTAENGGSRPYSLWFTGFAPAADPEVAVAVVVENGGGKGQSGSGDSLAAPVAKKVIEAVLGK